MKVNLNWLKDYVDIRMGTEELVHLLTMAGLEIERAESVGEGFGRVVVAQIDSIRRHPNADRLTLVEVKTGQERFSVVCGASNIREGQKVPLALVGAKLPNGMEIKRTKIRGVSSEGMLCSATELNLGQDASGIMILSEDVSPGTELAEALGLKDVIFDISITPNRADCLCVIGIAREVAALTHQRVKYPVSSLSDRGEEIDQRTSVTVLDSELCPRYVARMIEDVKIGPSPDWVRNRLEKVGIRPINNVVDVTNYVMMEYGQPLHAFDFDLLEGRKIVVRRAKQGETFVTLDGVERTLDDRILMICDGAKPVAIAGVMGGLNSEIRQETETVLLESAYFDPAGNRWASKKLGLETEAAYRFGRGIDHGGCLSAANRAAQMIQQLAGGRVVEGAVDVYPAPIKPAPIRLSVRKTNQILGTEIPGKEMKGYLEDLELDVQEAGEDEMRVIPPSFRRDLEREIDLSEEIARMYGYEKIPTTLPKGAPSSEGRSRELNLRKNAEEVLLHHGYSEVITYAFTSPSSVDGIGLAADDSKENVLKILNPLTEDFSVMRTTLLPGLLEVARHNISWKNSNLKIFELKTVFFRQKEMALPRELKVLAGFAAGLEADPHWAFSPRQVDFYDMKGCLEDLFDRLQIRGIEFKRAEAIPYLHPGRAVRVLRKGEDLGVLGEVHPEVLSRYEIQGRASLFEINFQEVVRWAEDGKRFSPLPKFPAVYRDLSLVVDESLEVEKVTETIAHVEVPFIDEIYLFDLYRGAPISEGKKGVTYRIRYQATDRTLTDEEVNAYHDRVFSRLREIFPLELRK